VVREYYDRAPDEESFADEVQAIEQRWPVLTLENSRLLASILGNDASLFLREYNRVVATFRELLVTDRYGRLVAASGKTGDYFQADETWWRRAYLEGEGQRYISDIVFDESARIHCIELAQPIRDESTGHVLGIVKAIVDSDVIFDLLERPRFGESAVAVALRRDGTIVTDPGGTETYPFTGDVFSQIELNRRSVALPDDDPVVFVGLPQFGIDGRIPGLEWYVVIQSPYDDVFAPFGSMRSLFMYIVGFGVALIIILSVVFTWVLSKPVIETDPHLEHV
jgi:hypothetical protein